MKRVLEPEELMDDQNQAEAYAASDFSETHEQFVDRFALTFPEFEAGRVADLCCGPADPTIRFARRYPRASVIGYDGAESMLSLGRQAVELAGFSDRIVLKQAMLPLAPDTENQKFDVVLCNGSMHHLPHSSILWESVKNLGRSGTIVFVRDLVRQPTKEFAAGMVKKCSHPTDPELMKRDLYNSLLAAFSPEEIRGELDAAGLQHFYVKVVNPRMVIYGILR